MDWGGILVDGLRAAVSVQAAVFALAAVGLNMHFGYTGLLNFGQAGFMLVGGYGVAVTVAQFGGPLWLGLLVGMLAAVVLALLLGVPTLRLRADYLAITTIAASEILRLLFRSNALVDVTGGVFGLQQFADGFYALNPFPPGSYTVGPVELEAGVVWVSLVGWGLVAACSWLSWRLTHSPWGRVVKSIREDEDAARSLGKNVFAYKLQSLALGGVFGALGGAVLAISTQAVTPDSYDPVVTFFAYTVLILGGAGKIVGPIVGAAVFWFLVSGLDTFLREAIAAGLIPGTLLASAETGAVRFALVGLGLMLLMIYRPEGMFGDRRELQLGLR
ncbi:branched-chain amino acid ABC transporter permease [soil metagenome]